MYLEKQTGTTTTWKILQNQDLNLMALSGYMVKAMVL